MVVSTICCVVLVSTICCVVLVSTICVQGICVYRPGPHRAHGCTTLDPIEHMGTGENMERLDDLVSAFIA